VAAAATATVATGGAAKTAAAATATVAMGAAAKAAAAARGSTSSSTPTNDGGGEVGPLVSEGKASKGGKRSDIADVGRDSELNQVSTG